MAQIGQRIVVIGTSGSGKTTLARRLAERLGYPHVELDALHWDASWTPAQTDVFRERVRAAIDGPTWVVDGNYGKVRDLVWASAYTVIWLDYALPLVMWRLGLRTIRRSATGEVLWNGNRERLRDHLLTKNSLFLWAVQTHGRHRREYGALFALPEYRHLTVLRFHSPRHVNRWLAQWERSLGEPPISL